MGVIIRGKIMKIESKDLIKTLQKWQESNTTYTGLKETALFQRVIDEIKRMETNEEIGQRIKAENESQNTQNEDEEIKAIIGMLNGDCTARFWKIPDGMAVDIGDHAVVENRDGYDLVEVVGLVRTTQKYEKNLVGNRKGIKSSVLAVILRELF